MRELIRAEVGLVVEVVEVVEAPTPVAELDVGLLASAAAPPIAALPVTTATNQRDRPLIAPPPSPFQCRRS